jgi:hypothetical protein
MASALHMRAAMKPFSILFFFAAVVVACSGGPDNTPSTSSSSSSGSSSSSKRAPSSNEESGPTESTDETSPPADDKPSGATNVACKTSDDCGNWCCDGKDSSGRVTPVNSANCIDGWCLDAASSCPKACSAFGKTWIGTAGGGPNQ